MHAPGRGKGAQGPWQHPLRPRGRAAPTACTTGAEAARRLKDPRRPAALMHAYIVVSLVAGVRPEEARAIGWEEDVDLDGNPPSVAVLRADRAGGDTKTPRSRRALKLAQVAVGALREWQVDQAAEREAAGSHWQDTGRVFTTATGTPLGGGTSGRCSRTFARGRVWQGLGASGPAAHVRLAAVRRWHGDREDRTACWPCQQPCHRDRVPTGAPAGPAGGRRGDGPALGHRQQRPG